MSLETRLRRELEREASRLPVDAGHAGDVMRAGRRRQLASATGVVMLVILLGIGLGVLLQVVEPSPGPVVTQPATPTTQPVGPTTTSPVDAELPALTVAGPEGISVVREDKVTPLFNEGPVMLAVEDLSGGYVFQIGVSASSILRVPDGSSEPVEVVAQEPEETLQLHEVAEIEGSPTVVYTARSGQPGTEQERIHLRLHDLAGGQRTEIAQVGGHESGVTRVSHAAGRFLLSKSAEGVTWFEFLAEDGSPVEVPGNPRSAQEAQDEFLIWVGHGVQSPDGSTMAYLRGHPRSEAPFELVVVDLLSGQELIVTPVEGARDTNVTRLEWNEELAVISFTDRPAQVLGRGEVIGRLALDGVATLAGTEESPPSSAAGLPAPVRDTRAAILAAAQAGEVERLADLALAGRESFSYSFGGDNPPPKGELIVAWEDPEVRRTLLTLLELPHTTLEGESETIYVWPSAFAENPTDEDWAAVETLYTPEEIASMKEFGGYIGYRVGITADGDWIFFVAGD